MPARDVASRLAEDRFLGSPVREAVSISLFAPEGRRKSSGSGTEASNNRAGN